MFSSLLTKSLNKNIIMKHNNQLVTFGDMLRMQRLRDRKASVKRISKWPERKQKGKKGKKLTEEEQMNCDIFNLLATYQELQRDRDGFFDFVEFERSQEEAEKGWISWLLEQTSGQYLVQCIQSWVFVDCEKRLFYDYHEESALPLCADVFPIMITDVRMLK